MTAEEFFRKKIKEKCPNQEIVTLANNLITAEDGMRWAYEFSQLPQQEISDEEIQEAVLFCNVPKESNLEDYTNGFEAGFEYGTRWYREKLKIKQ